MAGLEGTNQMNIDQMIVAIDEEMARLVKVKALLAPSSTTTNTPTDHLLPAKPKGTMSAEGRASIARAQRKRWRAVKKAQQSANLAATG